MSQPAANEVLQVACWNVLYDNRPGTAVTPQADRLPNLAATLRQAVPAANIVGMCEVEGDNGHELARQTGKQLSRWQQHDRPNEHIGLLAQELGSVTFLPLDPAGRWLAGIAEQGNDTAVAMVHLADRVFGSGLRTAQLSKLINYLAPLQRAVIMGDFNALPWQRPRRLLAAHGFQSVLKQQRLKHFPTMPTPDYRRHLRRQERIGSFHGFSFDDIYTRGFQAEAVGILHGDSDHLGLWAALRAAA